MDDPDGQRFGLAHITLADKPLFDAAFSALQQPITDYSFASTFVWSSSLKLYWAQVDRHLCLFANGTGDLTMLMPPIPQVGASAADLKDCLGRCFEIMDGYNVRHADRSHSRIEYVSDEMLETIQGVRGVTLSTAPMCGDYVYDMARMIDLAGGSLKSKRHARSKFMRLYPDHRTEPMDERHIQACRDLLALWHNHGDATHEGEVNDSHIGSDILSHREMLSCEPAFQHWRALGMKGMCLFVGDKLVGFTFGEALSPIQVSILIEKTHPDYDGAAQFIFSEFCRQYWAAYPECNAGDDWGIPSLRFTKESYRPIRLLSKSILTRQVPVVVGPPAIDVPIESPAHALPSEVAICADEAAPLPQPAGQDWSPRLCAACAEDVPAILGLEQVCFSSLEETFNRRQVRYLIASPRATVTVAENEGKIVGWSVGLVRQHRRSRSGRLYAVAVHPQAQGRRLGRALVEHTLGALVMLGIQRIYLEVRGGNQETIGLYHKLGFRDHRQLPNYYGQGSHGHSMRLAIPHADGDSLFADIAFDDAIESLGSMAETLPRRL